MATHTFALLKQRDINSCIERACDAVSEWESAWCPSSGIEIDCSETCDPSVIQPGGLWTAHRLTQGSLVWCYCPTEFGKQAERLIFDLNDALRSTDRHRESALAENVANEAVDELVALLLNRLAGPTTAQLEFGTKPADWQFRRHSGTALIKITIGGKTLSLLIPSERLPSHEIARKSPPREAVTPLPVALNKIEVRLIAELGDVEMSLGHFASLQLGDVINLSIGIDQSLTVFTENRCPVGVAHLGKQDGNRALEMFKIPHN
ncbi:FliM/FliN family flagellar motor switch protein [Solimicrobium silvestre]|uniref:Surface presentation of antigens (SPOA) n=1 Tax=Solimicrobium silvestre TaxID=2099400 RepID=A0A2S9H1S8_9BURK|nr:FliM/FliN family flagellar motor switch protein [Solimicrobium silvestre]PRC93918.1 Surface presentation of antigens (SPOA) [Solimicrobium silvestre]